MVGGGAVACPCAYPDVETAWQALVAAGPLQAALRVAGERQLQAVVRAALTPYVTGTGGVRLEHRFRYVTAMPDEDQRPGT